MTCQNNFTLPAALLEQIAVEGFYVIPGLSELSIILLLRSLLKHLFFYTASVL